MTAVIAAAGLVENALHNHIVVQIFIDEQWLRLSTR